jgi:hypothetical protein
MASSLSMMARNDHPKRGAGVGAGTETETIGEKKNGTRGIGTTGTGIGIATETETSIERGIEIVGEAEARDARDGDSYVQ